MAALIYQASSFGLSQIKYFSDFLDGHFFLNSDRSKNDFIRANKNTTFHHSKAKQNKNK